MLYPPEPIQPHQPQNAMTLTLPPPPAIAQRDRFRFLVTYRGQEPLRLDFEPLWMAAQELKPADRGVLVHWQGKPVGYRRFGVFEWSPESSSYSCCYKPEPVCRLHYPVQLEETPGLLPTAALYYPWCRSGDNTILA